MRWGKKETQHRHPPNHSFVMLALENGGVRREFQPFTIVRKVSSVSTKKSKITKTRPDQWHFFTVATPFVSWKTELSLPFVSEKAQKRLAFDRFRFTQALCLRGLLKSGVSRGL
jgi:hypothetical protein